MKRAILLPFCEADVPARPPSTATNLVNILFLMDEQHRDDWPVGAGAKWMITPKEQPKSQPCRASSRHIPSSGGNE
jgi:hypothetical protein